MRRILIGVLAFAPFALGMPAQDLDTPEAVARLELIAPRRNHFLLHGTIPIPKGIFPREDHKSPFAVLNHDAAGTLVPAQVEIVSRYPTGEADVVEIFAPVDLAPEDRPGAPVSFSIVASESKIERAPKVTARVASLLARQRRGSFGLRATDVYGNVYWADLSGNLQDPGFGSLRILKSGPWVRERRVYATMMPSGTPSAEGPPLPHLLGVHAYVQEVKDQNEVALDLRVNNGAISGVRPPSALESTLGIVYWRGIQLVLPAGWTAVADVADPFLGLPHAEGKGENETNVIPIVTQAPDGRLHMMGPQAQFERRFVLVPVPATKGAAHPPRADPEPFDPGLAFCEGGPNLWSWFVPATARYFPQRDLLGNLEFVNAGGTRGRLALRARAAKDLGALREGLTNGVAKGYYVYGTAMGWAHPWWVKEQGSPGGEGIATYEGYISVASASRENLDYLALLHRMNVCRQPQAAYDQSGDPVGYHAWIGDDGRVPFDFRLNGGVLIPQFLLPCARGPVASDQVREVVRRGLRPPYDLGDPYEPDGTWPSRDDCLLAWWPHDDQHYIRYTKQPKALVWLSNDSMAKDDLVLAAEMYHLARHESPHVQASWSVGRTLRVFEGLAQAHPHQGLPLGREDAWGIDAMCAAYSVAGDEWRAKNRPWFDRMSQLMLDGAMPTGIVQRMINIQLLGHTKYTATQTFESLFLIHAMRCMNESVFRGVDDAKRAELEKLVVRGVDYMFFGPPWARQPSSWQPYPGKPTLFRQGPRQAIAVSLNDDYETPPFCEQSPDYLPPDGLGLGVEWYHPWAALSYAQEITEGSAGAGLANRYLKRAIECGKTHNSWKELLQDFAEQASDPSYDNSPNWIGFLGKLQSLMRSARAEDARAPARQPEKSLNGAAPPGPK